MALDWSGLGQGLIGGAVGQGLGLLGQIGAGKRTRKLLQQQEEAQARLNEQNAELNFKYGEQAADAAHQRSLGLLQAETEANSYTSQVADLQNAGLNVGLLYGGAGGSGGGSAGGGAQGGGAGNQKGQAPNYLEIEAERTARKLAAAELTRTINESKLVNAEKEKTLAEAENLREQTDTSKELTPLQKEVLRQEGIQKLIETAKENGKLSGMGEKQEYYNDTLEWAITINNNSHYQKELELDIAKLAGEVEGINIKNALDTQAKEIAWKELLMAEAKNKVELVKAKAIALAAKFASGVLSKETTWRNAAKKGGKALVELLNEAE